MTLAAVVKLLQTALVLLALVSSHPELPASFRDNAISVAHKAIADATAALVENAQDSAPSAPGDATHAANSSILVAAVPVEDASQSTPGLKSGQSTGVGAAAMASGTSANPAPTCSITYTPAVVTALGQRVTAVWDSTDVTSRVASFYYPDGTAYYSGSNVPTSGTNANQNIDNLFAKPGTYVRKDTVTGPGGSATCSQTLQIGSTQTSVLVPTFSTITTTHRFQAGTMFGGWGPHLGKLLRAPDGSLWFADDTGNDVHVNPAIAYFHRVNGQWVSAGTQALQGVQQNVGSLLAADGVIYTYGIDVVNHRVVECTFSTNVSSKACTSLPFTLDSQANYIGAALSPSGHKIVWWTDVRDGGGGALEYIYNFGGGWNGPIKSDINGYNDLSYINIAFLDDSHFAMLAQGVTGLAPNWKFDAQYTRGEIGKQITGWRVLSPYAASDPVNSSNDLWVDAQKGVHIIAQSQGGKGIYYYESPNGSLTAPLFSLDAWNRTRFIASDDGNLYVLFDGPSGAFRYVAYPVSKIAGPIPLASLQRYDVQLSSGFGNMGAIYPESRIYQSSQVRGVNVALNGMTQQGLVTHLALGSGRSDPLVPASASTPPSVSVLVNGQSSITLAPGTPFTLTFATSNAQSCTAFTQVGSGAPSFWQATNPTNNSGTITSGSAQLQTVTYSISCTNAAGTVTKTATVSPVGGTNSSGTTLPPEFSDKFFSYAATYATAQAAYLAVGTMQLKADGRVSGTVWFEDTTKTDYWPSSKMHNEMDVPAGFKKACAPGRMMEPGIISNPQSVNGTWTYDGTTLKITLGSLVHSWKKDTAAASNAWALQGVASYQNIYGYAFLTGVNPLNTVTGPVTDSQIMAGYSSTFYQNNSGSALGSWINPSTGILWSTAKIGPDPDVRSMTFYIHDGSSEYAYHDVARNVANRFPNMLFENFGHDYNNDGCANENGHARLLYGIFEDSKLKNFLIVESSGPNSGALGPVPIIGIGRVLSYGTQTSDKIAMTPATPSTPTPTPTPPSVSVLVNGQSSITLASGTPFTFTFATSNAQFCNAFTQIGSGAPSYWQATNPTNNSGTITSGSAQPQTVTYSISCTNAAGTVTKTATVLPQ